MSKKVLDLNDETIQKKMAFAREISGSVKVGKKVESEKKISIG